MIDWLIWSLAYLLGSIPFGIIVARFQNIDIRQYGSGNIGATNIARTLGKTAGIITLGGDCLKGMASVALADLLLRDSIAVAVTGFVAFAGHIFSVFLKFKGGKGVATGLGVFIYLMPLPSLCAVGIFTITLVLTGYVSIGSMVATISLPIAGWWFDFPRPYIFTAIIVAILIMQKHRDNIKRLLAGTESQFINK